MRLPRYVLIERKAIPFSPNLVLLASVEIPYPDIDMIEIRWAIFRKKIANAWRAFRNRRAVKPSMVLIGRKGFHLFGVKQDAELSVLVSNIRGSA